MTESTLEEALRELAAQQKNVAEALEKNAKKGKDSWDKFATISTFLSTVIIAAIGGIFTHIYNLNQNERNEALKQQEIRISQIQTVEKFVPYLTGSEEQKKIAILALNSLGNTEVATKLASLYPSEGTITALQVIAKSGGEPERKLADQALQSIFDHQRRSVVQIAYGDIRTPEAYASGAIVSSSGYVVTAEYAVTAGVPATNGNKSLLVITADGKVHEATVSAVDKDLGIAVLKITGSGYPVLPLESPQVKSGDSVLAIGTKGKLALEPATGVVRAIDQKFVEVAFNSDIQGFGGGPVLSSEGSLIAMVYMLKPNDPSGKVDQCIRSDVIRTYLEGRKILSTLQE